MKTKFENAKLSPGFAFWKAANLHQRLQRQALKDLDITPSQFSVLACYFYLQRHGNLPTQADVCQHSSLDKMHVSDITKALIKKKYLIKKKNKADARSFLLELTELGSDVCNKSLKIIENLDHDFFSKSKNLNSFIQMLINILDSE